MKESDIRDKTTFDIYLKLVAEDASIYFKDRDKFKSVACVGCDSGDFEIQFKKNGFTYVLCNECGTLYVNPRPSKGDLVEFNTKSRSVGFWTNKFFLPTIESRRAKIFKPRAEFVAQRLPGGIPHLVGDIGAGFGLFLEEIKKIQPAVKAVAIEPSPEMAQICRKKGFEIIDKAIEDIEGVEDEFDFLSAFELVEHLYEPKVLFHKVYKMLKTGGLFLLTTLNCEGFDIQLLWERSRNIYPPQHINFLNPKSLKKALEETGFHVEELTTPGKLDWDIVENAIKEGIVPPDRLWLNFSKNASQDVKDDFQLFLARHSLSSHMRAIARK